MLGDYFYNSTIRKCIGAFGAMFNNLIVRRQTPAGAVLAQTRVPLAYAPIQKFLSRIDEQNKTEGSKKVALQLPRMAFEITSIAPDPQRQRNRMNKVTVSSNLDAGTRVTTWQSVPYNLEVSLYVLAKTQSDALQIVEQIIPWFAPEYTVTIKDIEGTGSKTDVPIVLRDVTPEIEYEGEFDTRGVVSYTFTFTIKTAFSGPETTRGLITDVDVDFFDMDDSQAFYSEISVTPDSDDQPSTVITDSDDGF